MGISTLLKSSAWKYICNICPYITSISISVGHFDRRGATLLLGQPNSAIKAPTLYCPGRWSVEMPRAAIGHFYKAALALKWLDLWSEHSLSIHICAHEFFDGRIIAKTWLLNCNTQKCPFIAARKIHGVVRYSLKLSKYNSEKVCLKMDNSISSWHDLAVDKVWAEILPPALLKLSKHSKIYWTISIFLQSASCSIRKQLQ